jgi:hypothetical protein
MPIGPLDHTCCIRAGRPCAETALAPEIRTLRSVGAGSRDHSNALLLPDTIESADTAPMALSSPKCLGLNESLNHVSTVSGQDQVGAAPFGGARNQG